MNGKSTSNEAEVAPPLCDYAFLSDCHSSALVSRDGSIDWCCMPRIDSPSCFGRLLGWENGGYFRIAPRDEYRVERRYRGNSLILETTFRTDGGAVRVVDCLPMRVGGRHEPYRQILRVVEGLEGTVALRVDLVPRFDYGAISPWIRRLRPGRFHAVGGADGLLITSDLPLEARRRHDLGCECPVAAGERRYVSIIYGHPENLEDERVAAPKPEHIEERMKETERWWARWMKQAVADGFDPAQSRRSAVVLKGLTQAITGAIAAAATTSLPEAPGGSRNWDYRFTWVRDSVYAIRALLELGFTREADGFRRFVERTAAGNAREVQILYGVDGRRRLSEQAIEELSGYQGAAPVRVGNAAATQLQLDVLGELLDLAHRWHLLGNSPDEDYWEFIVSVLERTIELWRKPDQSLWEMRGKPRHFVHSKALCWAALDRGIRLAEELEKSAADLPRWRRERDAIRAEVESKGYDAERGVFTQSFGSKEMDAALLLLPVFGFVPFTDERMVRTVDAVRKELGENGLLRRYGADNDELDGREGTFIACTFWMAECLARQGRLDEAREAYAVACETRNDLGLFSEEYESSSKRMLGNFPQALTHLSQIAAAVAIDAAKEDSE
jgi:GH15 family glucan-1,4-alpha-glucosidase